MIKLNKVFNSGQLRKLSGYPLLKLNEELEEEELKALKEGIKVESLTSLIHNGYIIASKNNTRVMITLPNGNPLINMTGGNLDLTGFKRGTAAAAENIALKVGEKAKALGVNTIKLYTIGFGKGRESGIKGLKQAGLHILAIIDVTPVTLNGCRLRKEKRV